VEVYLKLKNLGLLILAIVIAMICAHIAQASEYGDIAGMVGGKKWIMKAVTLKKITNGDTSVVVLRFFDKNILEEDLCKAPLAANNILIQIPLSTENGSLNAGLDYEGASIQIGENEQQGGIRLKEDELNSTGLAYVSGKLQILSQKTRTEVNGTFKAKVCNSEQNI
jgi:hypothetical protein